MGSSKIDRDVIKDLGKAGLKAEKPLRNIAGNMLEKAAGYGAKKIRGGWLDIHEAIGKLPRPKRGWVLPGYNYLSPYNPLYD